MPKKTSSLLAPSRDVLTAPRSEAKVEITELGLVLGRSVAVVTRRRKKLLPSCIRRSPRRQNRERRALETIAEKTS
jgi:hypothetical protein